MKNNILVLGGKGKTGRRVVRILKEKGHNVRVGSRSENPAFDWEKPETWGPALEGMDGVYITFQPDLAVPGALEAIEALAKEAGRQGVKKLVLLSGKGEREAELCEQAVMNSGLDYTIVRASWFSQNYSESFFLEPIQHGFVALPMADTKVPYVDAEDIAAVAVEALLDAKHNGEIYELTGSRFLTFREVIAEISKTVERNIVFTPVSLPAYTKMLREYGLDDDYVWLINYLFSEVLDNPDNQVITKDVEKVLGRKPKDFSEFVKETAATGIWSQTVAS
ncbi:SDR family oxidoreductase [Flagellimonas allohymeniacidonis]|uniref:NmrA family transcriptional regulator n=1 Tax=Flagellimonas allohymeniacidonis TaxID=2517819 RepID=A0A4Q8QCM6_9FLAO|nr:NAD(P)H-binding protein [Allomuricauda hymeniacidonis]TAI48135.1 NmrA family transcriptional regulator [Allomuricauda hymeniacidonis]